MKLNANALSRQAQNGLKPCYWIAGDELLLVEEALDCLRQAAIQQGFNERVKLSGDSSFNASALYRSSENLSLFASKKCFELRLPNKPTAKVTEALLHTLTQLDDDHLLIVISPKLTAAQQRSKLLTQFDQLGCIITVWPVKPEHLGRFIHERAQGLKLKIDRDAVTRIAQFTQGNLLATQQLLKRLANDFSDQTISVKHIDELSYDQALFEVYELTDQLLLGNSAACLNIINHLQQAQAEPTHLVWTISKALRDLLILSEQDAVPFAQTCKQLGIWPNKQALYQAALKRLSLKQIQDHLLCCAQLDRIIKGLMPGHDFWQVLRENILDLPCSSLSHISA